MVVPIIVYMKLIVMSRIPWIDERETDRQRDREKQRGTERETETDRDRETDREATGSRRVSVASWR